MYHCLILPHYILPISPLNIFHFNTMQLDCTGGCYYLLDISRIDIMRVQFYGEEGHHSFLPL